jgi:hypothetical protein
MLGGFGGFWKKMWQQHLELFPAEFRKGFKLHDSYRSIKQALCLRRIKRKATGAQLSAKCILCLTRRKHWPIWQPDGSAGSSC